MSASAAELKGLYRLGSNQVLALKTDRDKVEGFASSPGPCNLKPTEPVLTGSWESGVLVGEVTLCQVGPGCGPQRYSFLGFFDAADGSVTADLELETSCDLPALSKDGRLVLVPLPAGAAEEASASVVAAGVERRKLGAHTLRGQQLIEENPAGAMKEFQRALEHREDPMEAYHGMGIVEANRKRWPQAVKYYRRALQIRPDAFTYYNLACAYARLQDRKNALANLRLAIRHGFVSDQELASEEDLLPLLGTDPEFHALLAELQEKNSASTLRRPPP